MFLRALVSRHRERKSSSNKMAAGLSGGQTKQNGHHKSQHRTELKHTHINLAVLIRHFLKYKNTVSQKTFYRDTELQMSSKVLRGGKEKKEEEAGRGAKGVDLQTSPATCRHPGVTGLFPGLPEKGGLELGPTRNQTRKFQFSAKKR